MPQDSQSCFDNPIEDLSENSLLVASCFDCKLRIVTSDGLEHLGPN